jgi:hypothetical protein
MKKATESGELEKFFTQNGSQSSFGFSNRLARTADKVASSPDNYVTGSNAGYGNNFGDRFNINNIGKNDFTSFQQIRISNYFNIGLLLDMMF